MISLLAILQLLELLIIFQLSDILIQIMFLENVLKLPTQEDSSPTKF